MSTESAGTLFREGRLGDAIAAAGDAARRAPDAADPRILLAELLLFAGRLDRADTVLETAARIDASASLVAAEFRQLLRAAMARRQVLRDGRPPDFLGQPTPAQTRSLLALTALRAGDRVAAADAAAEAEQERPAVRGNVAETPFADWRDACDLWAGSFEVLTSTGKYFWIPTERVVSMEFHAPRRPRDLFWRRCTMVVRDGPDGEVYLPALYESEATSDALRLGLATEWSETAPVCGIGQRVFLVGEEGIPIHQLTTVEFA